LFIEACIVEDFRALIVDDVLEDIDDLFESVVARVLRLLLATEIGTSSDCTAASVVELLRFVDMLEELRAGRFIELGTVKLDELRGTVIKSWRTCDCPLDDVGVMSSSGSSAVDGG
jgi:hypothetical protein